MKTIISLLLCVGLTFACQRVESNGNNHIDKAKVTFEVLASTQQVISRSTIEDRILDINLYLFGEQHNTAYHCFSTDSAPLVEIPYDRYTVYIIANAGADLGEKTEIELAPLKVSNPSYGSLVMSGINYVEIKKEDGVEQILPAIFVTRCTSRIDYNIRISEEANFLSLHSVQFVNIPKYISPFDHNGIPSEDSSQYFNSEIEDLSGNGAFYGGRIYLNENLQGRNEGIESEKDKNHINSPLFATYMRVRARDAYSVYDYFIYLGENTTDDFNIRRNTTTTINITIEGTDKFDWRIHAYSVELTDTGKIIDNGTYYDIRKELYIDCMSGVYAFTAKVKVDCADNTKVWINGQNSSEISFDINPYNIYKIDVRTDLGVITPYNENMSLRIIITDDIGYDFEIIEHVKLNNYVAIAPLVPYEGCTVKFIDNGKPVYSSKNEDGFNCWYIIAGNSLSFAKVTTSVNFGFDFHGWADEQHNHIGSDPVLVLPELTKRITQFYYVATPSETVKLYTDIESISFESDGLIDIDEERGYLEVICGSKCDLYFIRDGIHFLNWMDNSQNIILGYERRLSLTVTRDLTIEPVYDRPVRLDDNGTANCYMFNFGHSTYCFDGTKKGNHKITGIITPKEHIPVSVKILWSTGPALDYLIKSIGCHKNDVEFTITGRKGNALMGVFDDQQNLLWSYHLWIGPNRTLATNSHLYSGVSVSWMDRYLGALETGEGTRLFGRGLYYQWGRKDPFVHNSEAITYNSDYEFKKVESSNSTSVDFAKDNPTTFIYNPSPTAGGSWLAEHLNYLWGTQKTIYDPCPPGWKVPAFTYIQSINFTQRPISVVSDYFRFKNTTNNLDVFYFKGGYLDGSDGNERNDINQALIGSATSDNHGVGVLSIQNSRADKIYMPVSTATKIRCIKE